MKRNQADCLNCKELKSMPFFPSIETCKGCGMIRLDTTLSIVWTCECGKENVRDCRTFIMTRCNATPEPWVLDEYNKHLDIPVRCVLNKTCGTTNEFDDAYWKERLRDVSRK